MAFILWSKIRLRIGVRSLGGLTTTIFIVLTPKKITLLDYDDFVILLLLIMIADL